MQLALYQPDIPQNVGSILRLSACFGVKTHIIEPCGFAFDDKRMKRAGMDYVEHAEIARHASWNAFLDFRQSSLPGSRLILMTTKGSTSIVDFTFSANDILLLGQESAGVPVHVAEACDGRVKIPLRKSVRSLNVSQAAAIALAEGLRQTEGLPSD